MPAISARLTEPLLSQAVLRRHHEIQRVVPHRGGAHQVVGLGRQGDHRHFSAAMEDLFVGHFRIEKLNIQRHVRGIAG